VLAHEDTRPPQLLGASGALSTALHVQLPALPGVLAQLLRLPADGGVDAGAGEELGRNAAVPSLAVLMMP
jgi:hypothetical protein